MQPVLPLWAVIIVAAIVSAAIITLLAIGFCKAIKFLRGPEFINDDCVLDDTVYGPVPKEDFVL